MVNFALERISDILPEAEELWRLHWEETEAPYRGVQGYSPDIAQYMNLDRLGWFAEFTARDNGRLVGHLGFIVHRGRHTRRLGAIEDYFYIRQEHRGGGNGMKLLKFAIDNLKSRGCTSIGMSSKVTHDISPLLKKAGFSHVAELWTMNVEENL